MAGFLNIPNGPITLTNATVPGCLIGASDDLTVTDISIADGKSTDQGEATGDLETAQKEREGGRGRKQTEPLPPGGAIDREQILKVMVCGL